MKVGIEQLVGDLLREGVLENERRVRARVRLGYPSWMILEGLGRERILDVLSAASGVPRLHCSVKNVGLNPGLCELYGPENLKAKRWLPLYDGRVAVADPLRDAPDGVLAGYSVCVADARDIDEALELAFPDAENSGKKRRRLGRFLIDSGVVDEEELADALTEQLKSGGRLGEILLARGSVEAAALTEALAAQVGLPSVADGELPTPLLSNALAHELRAVALLGEDPTEEPVPVAFVEPTEEKISRIEKETERSVTARITDDETLDALLAATYAEQDILDVIGALQSQRPHFSAFRNTLSKAQAILACILGVLIVFGLVVNAYSTVILVVAICTAFYILYTLYRLYSAWQGWHAESTIKPSDEDLENLDERALPLYTILLPVYKEKPSTVRALISALSKLDYPRHKLNGILLVEADDEQTQQALEVVSKPPWVEVLEVPDAEATTRPAWLKTLLIPPGEPRTKPKAMIYGLLYARGELLTIYDAEDQPEPDQLKKAAWAFERSGEDVACIQAKLSYYNSRQNLLTRWFTLEYAAWFDLFLPGLHQMSAPIPLGGTSNHFRTSVLKEALSWDPYNVTEDADLGLRFTRTGYKTLMLESTTYEEANSKVKNWLRQRSRWIKGYMQTFLVHTRSPATLYKELGFVNLLHFLATIGGLIYTVLISPVFWVLLVIWLLLQPGWIPGLFPGPIYYLALVSLLIGNFFFVFIGLIGAVGRGQDDLSPYTLLAPVYWMMMSVAGYMALYELIRKPHYWQKTEHGLHFEEEMKKELPATTQ